MSLSPEMWNSLKKLIVKHEDYEKFPYFDNATPPNITIGIGYNLSARGLPDEWINAQYNQDVNYFYNQLCHDYPWFCKMCEPRQIALIDMCFMGYKKFQEFHHMLESLEQSDYETAACCLLDSLYAREVPERAHDLATIIRRGTL